jgi:hypothetical protein
LVVELGILAILLLPLPGVVLRPATKLLASLNSYVLYTWILLVVLFLIGCSFAVYSYENREIPTEFFANQQHKLARFRAERNWYITLMSFILLIVIYRVRQLVSLRQKLREQADKTPKRD